MALFTQTVEGSAPAQKATRFRRSVEDSSERTLVAPQMLKRPAGRVIYWTVLALLLGLTLITFGPLYWMFSSALKPSIEIFSRPQTFWSMHPAWKKYVSAWNL